MIWAPRGCEYSERPFSRHSLGLFFCRRGTSPNGPPDSSYSSCSRASSAHESIAGARSADQPRLRPRRLLHWPVRAYRTRVTVGTRPPPNHPQTGPAVHQTRREHPGLPPAFSLRGARRDFQRAEVNPPGAVREALETPPDRANCVLKSEQAASGRERESKGPDHDQRSSDWLAWWRVRRSVARV